MLVAPPGGEQTRAALATLGAARDHPLVQAAADPAVIIVDAGRLDPGSASLGLIRAADELLLLSHATASDLAHLAARLDEVSGWNERIRLVLAGDGYPDSEVARELGQPVLARIPADPVEAATLTGRIPPRRRPVTRATLTRTASQVASALATSHQPLSRPEPTVDNPTPDGHNTPDAAEPVRTAVSSPLLNERLT